MNSFEDIKVILKTKSGKKLTALSVIVFLIITVIVFFVVLRLCVSSQLKQIDGFLSEVPDIIESQKNEMVMRSRVYEEDVLTRAELGLMIYKEEDGLTDGKRLERVRDAVDADSVTLLNVEDELLDTTGPVSPDEIFLDCIRELEPGVPHLELNLSGSNDGKFFVLLRIPGNTDQSLVYEFSCDDMLEMYNTVDDWSYVLELMLSGANAAAFAKTGGQLAGYPLDGLTDDQKSQLNEELTRVFQKNGSFLSIGSRRSVGLVTLLGDHYLAAQMHYPQEDTDILLAVPLERVVGNSIYIATAISVIIGWGIVLIQIYVFRRLMRKKEDEDEETVSCEVVYRTMRSGILVMLVVTILFSDMLLMLENRTDAAITALAGRIGVQYEIDLRGEQEDAIRRTFEDCYRKRAQMLTAFLSEYPEYQTRDGLEELNQAARTDYLMRFDSAGHEVAASNSYTGFSIGNNLSGEYRAVLMGYPYAIAGPEADPYTGRMQLGTAILMTDKEGQPDGFLLAVYGAGDLNAELKRMSYENAVNSYTVHEGQIAAAINDEDGLFTAHTDLQMIGQKAEDYFLDGYEPGSSFEGFADYNGEPMCISARAADGMTLLFMVPERGESSAQANTALMSLAALLILALLYYPIAGRLIAQVMTEAKDKLPPYDGLRNPLTVFSDGYSVFLTLFAIFALIASYNGWWTSFDYVFFGNWSGGVHLLSIWTALFIVAITLCLVFLIRTVLKHLESRLSLQGKTATRLMNSLIIYAAGIFLVFCILGIFGVNTTALLASAGIISIAVGMGAQSMAADLLAGFFMIMEGSIHVGDHVSVSGVTGYVTDMGIRTTEITDEEGNVVILNNSNVSPVQNMSRKHSQPQNDPEKKQEDGA